MDPTQIAGLVQNGHHLIECYVCCRHDIAQQMLILPKATITHLLIQPLFKYQSVHKVIVRKQ